MSPQAKQRRLEEASKFLQAELDKVQPVKTFPGLGMVKTKEGEGMSIDSITLTSDLGKAIVANAIYAALANSKKQREYK